MTELNGLRLTVDFSYRFLTTEPAPILEFPPYFYRSRITSYLGPKVDLYPRKEVVEMGDEAGEVYKASFPEGMGQAVHPDSV